MSEYSEILNDARWLPHGFGAATGTDSATISFIRIAAADFRQVPLRAKRGVGGRNC